MPEKSGSTHANSSNSNAVAYNTTSKGVSMPAVSPVQMTTVDEWFAGGKKVVIAGEDHGEIPVEQERTYWRGKRKRVVYEEGFLNVNIDEGEDNEIDMPADHHYARMMTSLGILTEGTKALALRENLPEAIDAFENGDMVSVYLNNIMSDADNMGEVRQAGFDAPYTREQLASARRINTSILSFFDLMGSIKDGTKGAQDLNTFNAPLLVELNWGKANLGVGPGNNLRQIRSKRMTDILEGYSKHVETPSVYKVGELHITDIKTGAVEGNQWVAVDREQYLQDTGLQETPEQEEGDDNGDSV